MRSTILLTLLLPLLASSKTITQYSTVTEESTVYITHTSASTTSTETSKVKTTDIESQTFSNSANSSSFSTSYSTTFTSKPQPTTHATPYKNSTVIVQPSTPIPPPATTTFEPSASAGPSQPPLSGDAASFASVNLALGGAMAVGALAWSALC